MSNSELEVAFPPTVIVTVTTKPKPDVDARRVDITIPELSLAEYSRFVSHFGHALDDAKAQTEVVPLVLKNQAALGKALSELLGQPAAFYTEEIGAGKLAKIVGVLAQVNYDFFADGVGPLLALIEKAFGKIGGGSTPFTFLKPAVMPTPVDTPSASSTGSSAPPTAPIMANAGTA